MKKPLIPHNEEQRLRELDRLEILDTAPEDAFDIITKWASEYLGTPISLVSLVDKDRQWFKSKHGLDASETPRDLAFCAHAIHQDNVFEVENALEDERFHDNPLVTGEPRVIFYAGIPLKLFNSVRIGTLCVIDHKPRKLNQKQIDFLIDMGTQIENILLMRLQHNRNNKVSVILDQLHSLNKLDDFDFHDVAGDYLKIGSKIFGMEYGIISCVDNDNYMILDSLSPAKEFEKGDSFELKNTLCEEVIESKKTVCYQHIGDVDRLKDHPVYVNMKLESYISTPLWINGEVYGTVNFSSVNKQDQIFYPEEISFIELLASKIARRIEITQRRNENENIRNLLDLTPELVAITELPSLRLEYSNKAFNNTFDKSKKLDFSQIHPEVMSQTIQEEAIPMAKIQGHWKGESTIINKDGSTTPVLQTIVIQKNKKGEPLYASTMMQDISDMKKFEQDLIMSKEDAQAASKAKSFFLANMSHEIRTPLNSIIGVSDLLLETELDEEQAHYVKVFKDSGKHLLEIVNDILDLSKIEAAQLELRPVSYSFDHELDKIFKIFRHKYIDSDVETYFEVSPKLEKSYLADKTRVNQILVNLIGNALKFTSKGKVSVRVTPNPLNHKNGNILIEVSDTGIGIEPKNLETIFDDFMQAEIKTTKKYGGTGLGLSITKKLCELMKGQIWVESLPGKGSSFYVSLQLKEDVLSKPQKLKKIAPVVPLDQFNRNYNVLVVDDNPNNRMILQAYLKKGPFKIFTAENGAEALEIMKKEYLDIVFMDLQMPVKDGFDTVKEYRAWESLHRETHLCIASLSAYALSNEIEKAIECGCDYSLTKPIEKKLFLEFLTEQINRLDSEKKAS